jgi:hypothetical protein
LGQPPSVDAEIKRTWLTARCPAHAQSHRRKPIVFADHPSQLKRQTTCRYRRTASNDGELRNVAASQQLISKIQGRTWLRIDDSFLSWLEAEDHER